ncbi:B-cell receptor CD22-like isoform X1, partial [Clarias magur]
SRSVGVHAGVGVVVFVCICLIATSFFIRKKKRTGTTQDQQEDFYSNIAVTNPINRPPDTASPNQDESLYASVERHGASDSRNKTESPAVEVSASEQDEVQYASVRFTRAGADY